MLSAAPEIVSDEVSELLVPVGLPMALANAIERVLADKILRNRPIEAGRRVLVRPTLEEYFRNVSALVQSDVRSHD